MQEKHEISDDIDLKGLFEEVKRLNKPKSEW
jgi:hypothetical protein